MLTAGKSLLSEGVCTWPRSRVLGHCCWVSVQGPGLPGRGAGMWLWQGCASGSGCLPAAVGAPQGPSLTTLCRFSLAGQRGLRGVRCHQRGHDREGNGNPAEPQVALLRQQTQRVLFCCHGCLVWVGTGGPQPCGDLGIETPGSRDRLSTVQACCHAGCCPHLQWGNRLVTSFCWHPAFLGLLSLLVRGNAGEQMAAGPCWLLRRLCWELCWELPLPPQAALTGLSLCSPFRFAQSGSPW